MPTVATICFHATFSLRQKCNNSHNSRLLTVRVLGCSPRLVHPDPSTRLVLLCFQTMLRHLQLRWYQTRAALKHLSDRKQQSVGALQTEVQRYQDNLGLVLVSSAGEQRTGLAFVSHMLALLTKKTWDSFNQFRTDATWGRHPSANTCVPSLCKAS